MTEGRKKNMFEFRKFTIFQEHCAMKVGTDGVVMSGLTSLFKNHQEIVWDSIWDSAPFCPIENEIPSFKEGEPANILVGYFSKIYYSIW